MLTSNSLSQAEILIGQNITSLDGSVSGTVGSVTVTDTGSTAILTNGKTLSLSNGAVIQ